MPDERVVQAWRFGAGHDAPWEPGVYSNVCFTLASVDGGTCLSITHTGIPDRWVDHLSQGYPMFYLEPIAKHFAK